MYVLLIFLLVTGIRAQLLSSQCSCACCLGQACAPSVVGSFTLQNCSVDACATQCRCAYSQCAATYPYGQVLVQCLPPPTTYFNCACQCCNTGTVACIPTFVGYTTAPSCDTCNIACYANYPSQCVIQTGQTQSICGTVVTTTTTASTIAPWLGYICSCLYCQFGSTCSSGVMVAVSSASQCSSSECTQACQNRYSSSCSTTYLSQISGTCLSQGSGKTKCKCNCCRGFGCIDYEVNSNDTCTSCYSKCQQVSPCTNTPTVTYTCAATTSIITSNLSLQVVIMIYIIVTKFFNY
jgi:hypothetical protein